MEAHKVVHYSGKPGISITGRTSIVPMRAIGIFAKGTKFTKAFLGVLCVFVVKLLVPDRPGHKIALAT
jgi:hypothetical protein